MERVNKKQLGDRIRELRTAAGHTQDDLAELLDQKRQVVSYYENGTRMPNIEQIMTIAKEYNTTTDYLLGLTDVATTDKDILFVCEVTGLTEKAVHILNYLKFNGFEQVSMFANSLINYLDENKYNINQFMVDKHILFAVNDDVLNLIPDMSNLERCLNNLDDDCGSRLLHSIWNWKRGNELHFKSAKLEMHFSFLKLLNDENAQQAEQNINCLYDFLNKDEPINPIIEMGNINDEQ